MFKILQMIYKNTPNLTKPPRALDIQFHIYAMKFYVQFIPYFDLFKSIKEWNASRLVIMFKILQITCKNTTGLTKPPRALDIRFYIYAMKFYIR